MADPHVLTGLIAKRDEIAGQIGTPKASFASLRCWCGVACSVSSRRSH